MPSVVIIHAAEDALPARALAEKLRAAKLTPVIEQAPGDALRQAVRDAAVTLALWSPRSVGQAALIDEVSFAQSRGKLMHVRMQNAPTPEPFASENSNDLTGWRGEDEFPAWRTLLQQVANMAGVALSPPPPRGPSGPAGFFQPGAPSGAQAPRAAPAPASARAPQQRPAQAAPRPQTAPPRPQAAAPPRGPEPDAPKGGGSGMMIGIIALVVIAIIGGGGYFAWTNMQGSQASSTAWDNVPRNDASALRAFIDADPGQFRDEAQAALTALEEQSFDAAQEEDTIDAFEGFLNDFPESDHAIAARGRIAELQSLPPAEEGVAPDGTLVPDPNAPPVDPDLLPPAAPEAPAPDTGGPAPLTPPVPEPTPAPAPAPDPGAPLAPTN